MTIDDDRDLDGLRRAGRAVADARDEMLAAVAPGITTARLDDRTMLHEGLVLAIEPFLTTGPRFIVDADDGWTLRTPLGDPIAQFEHTVVVTAGTPIVLTAPLAV